MPPSLPFPALKQWAVSIVVTVVLLSLIAAAIGGETWEVSTAVLATVVAVATLLHRLFPGSRFFTITFANAIGVYACLYASFLESLYTGVDTTVALIGFLLPILAFATGVFIRRHAIRSVIASAHPHIQRRFGRAFLWLIPVALIGFGNFIVPLGSLDPLAQSEWLLVAMGAIALVVLLASRNVAVFLIDTGLLFEDFFETVAGLVKPAFAFLTFYSMIVVLFATLYRLLGRLDTAPTFMIDGTARDPTFVESLYFSIITLSTVGYGDIVPITYAARIVVALQVVSGIMLLLFGFHALMRRTSRGS
ncbi:potassium channel family protein [Thalassobaculum sp.]|uniref:potassium channel family protein n=1 Tax=Thalassobaculum sp. TaxID=2022740 RepID=UPI0032EFCD31